MNIKSSVVAVYDTHSEAEVRELQKLGFPMTNLSIVGKDYHSEEHVVGYYNAASRVAVWGKLGASWGGLLGLLCGSALFLIPGIGPLVILGPLATWLLGALEGAVVVGGLSVLGATLYSIGIPKDSIIQYETALKAEKFLIIAHGTHEQAEHARHVLDMAGASEAVAQHKALLPAGVL